MPLYSDKSQLKTLIKGTILESYQILEKNIHSIIKYLEDLNI